MRFILISIAAASLVASVGCTIRTSCSAIFESPLGVIVRDGTTGQPVCDATVVVQHGPHTEQLMAPGPAATGTCEYFSEGADPGPYTVTVTRSGYTTTTITAPAPQEDDCGTFTTEHVTVTLPPQ